MSTLTRVRLVFCLIALLLLGVDSRISTAGGYSQPQQTVQKKDRDQPKKKRAQEEKDTDEESEDSDEPQQTDDDDEADDEEAEIDEDAEDEDSDEESDDEDEDQDEEDGDKQEEPEEPKTIKLSGFFVATESAPVMRRPDEWSTMKILNVVVHGEKVRRGETLLQLDAEKLDLAIEDLKHDVELGEVGLEQAKHSLRMLDKSNELAEEAAQRSEERAMENLARFLSVDKQASIESVEFSLEYAENYLAYQEEELKQLEQMYEADDLTEETEEIILKRTRDSVQRAKHSLERAKLSRDRGLDVDIPRRQEQYEVAVKEAAIALEKAKASLPAAVQSAELKLKKQELAQAKLETKLERMKSDLEAMTIKAPMGGRVYYGECKNGKWSDATALQTTLKPGGTIKPGQVFMTIVKMQPQHIVASVAEKDLRHVSEDLEVVVVPTAFPDMEIEGKVSSISAIPVAAGKFTVQIEMMAQEKDIVPGMSCEVQIELPEDEDEADEDEDEDEDEDKDEDKDEDEE